MSNKNDSAISRRQFASRVVLVSAAASVTPVSLFHSGILAASLPAPAPAPPQQPSGAAKLSPESQADVDSRIQAILTQYGNRLSDAQKADIRRLATEAQPTLDRLRAYVTENGEGPGLYLKPLMEREKKPSPAPTTPKPAKTPKNS